MTLLIVTIVVLAALALGIMYIVGFFNKRVNGHVNLTFGIIRTLKINWKNLWCLPSRLRLLMKIWPHKRSLLFLKIRKKLKANRRERKKRRHHRRYFRKTKRQKNRSH